MESKKEDMPVAMPPGAFYDLYKQVAGPMLKALGDAEIEPKDKLGDPPATK